MVSHASPVARFPASWTSSARTTKKMFRAIMSFREFIDSFRRHREVSEVTSSAILKVCEFFERTSFFGHPERSEGSTRSDCSRAARRRRPGATRIESLRVDPSTGAALAQDDRRSGPFALKKFTNSAVEANAPSVALRQAISFGAIAVMAAAIAGCAAGVEPAPVVRPLMVQVPVLHETPCPVPSLTHPALPIAGLKPGSSPADTMRAYAAAVTILKGAVRERDAVLAGCARPSPQTNPPAQAQAENTQ